MIRRNALQDVRTALGRQAAVALIGPRQVGKTTLALEIAEETGAVYLDLEAGADRAKLADPVLYLRQYEDRLVILDEIHRVPELFQELRGLIDAGRRRGRRTGRFLMLGSASIDLLRQSGESLAGRIEYVELGPLNVLEIDAGMKAATTLWVRGGFPDSFLAASDADSLAFRENFIRTYLERDVPLFGGRIPAETLGRLWTMLAHAQGAPLNASKLASSLAVSVPTVIRYIDLLADLLLVRRLPPFHANTGKRLVKSPKTYVRDSGIVHALLGIGDFDALAGHPVAGPSFEGFAIENILAACPPRTTAGFYRTAAGAEIDLVLDLPGRKGRWAVEIKRGLERRAEPRPPQCAGGPDAEARLHRLWRRGAISRGGGHRGDRAQRDDDASEERVRGRPSSATPPLTPPRSFEARPLSRPFDKSKGHPLPPGERVALGRAIVVAREDKRGCQCRGRRRALHLSLPSAAFPFRRSRACRPTSARGSRRSRRRRGSCRTSSSRSRTGRTNSAPSSPITTR